VHRWSRHEPLKEQAGEQSTKEINMNKLSLFKRAAAAAGLSASAFAGVGAVGIMAAGTANARPMCEILFETAGYESERFHAAVRAGQSSEAAFWRRSFQNTRAEWKRQQCGQ
jgi:hypothetical protein